MVICNSHNFIFLTIPRCASTSLSAFFVTNFCTAPKDEWMPIHNDTKQKNVNDEIITFGSNGPWLVSALQEAIEMIDSAIERAK